ncbi:MAG: hybrid sensor histidine kinase/response regulator [Verrucomicrobiales bacterium]|nr:hybrid sensor histidine kinase/response regulator [Verrucomicrobiales bacterium]
MELLAEMVASAIGFRLQMEREKELSASLMEAEKHSSMGHLVAGIAHEVNNPLTAILGCAELLAQESEDPATANSMQVICSQAKRAGDLVKQLLSFARISSPEDRETLTISRLINEVDEMVRPSIKMSGIYFEAFTEEVGLVCEVNRIQIQQILINLVNNAEQAISSSSISRGRITIAARGNGDCILIEVRDNGPGLKAGTLKRIFDPFFTTKEEGKGTGLGLSISRDIALSHGGELSCQTPVKGGCVFTLSVPRLSENQSRMKLPVKSLKKAKSTANLRLLIIDDEAPIRWMLKRLLSPCTELCRVAESAEEALELSSEHDFNVVVSDFHLPGLDGIEFYEQVSGGKFEQFVIITGDASSPRLTTFEQHGNVEILEKPFDLAEIKGLVQRPLGEALEATVALPA